MPLYRSRAEDAIKLRKANPYSYWGSRESTNRIEPIADPHFDLALKLEQGDSIFTIGSCFARNVEGKLAAAGFSLPMRDMMNQRTFAGVPPTAINNFSTPSIWNELAWAVGESAFDPELGIVEYAPGKWVDLHVTANVRPASRDTVLRRRAAITAAYRNFAQSKLIIVTLGLVEVWYDTLAGCYLNSIPAPPLVRRFPDRFELHVLSYNEALDYCDRAVQLLRGHGRSGATILISISPVALGVTHRPEDVMSANCYSKSVLRAVAEEVVSHYDNVQYFPSYESVTLSDRRIAWANDFTHVTELLIAHNVDRLVQRLTHDDEREGALESMRAEIRAGGASAAYRWALHVRRSEPSLADAFFDEFGEWSDRSPTFATEHVEWLVDKGRVEEAIEIAGHCEFQNERVLLAKARAHLLRKRPDSAIEVLDDPLLKHSRSSRYWSLRVTAQGKAGDLAGLETTLVNWCAACPKHAPTARTHVARAMLTQSSVSRAIELLDLALVEQPNSALAHMLSAEAHLLRGDKAAARRSFELAEPKTASEDGRHAKLKDRMAELIGA